MQQALTHIPDAQTNPAQLHRVNAWLAAQRGDVVDERRELALLVAADPAALTAVDRLAELAAKDGQPARAAELLRGRADIARALARYLKLHDRKQPIRDAVELARLAERLGRHFEARAFLAIANSEEPARSIQ